MTKNGVLNIQVWYVVGQSGTFPAFFIDLEKDIKTRSFCDLLPVGLGVKNKPEFFDHLKENYKVITISKEHKEVDLCFLYLQHLICYLKSDEATSTEELCKSIIKLGEYKPIIAVKNILAKSLDLVYQKLVKIYFQHTSYLGNV